MTKKGIGLLAIGMAFLAAIVAGAVFINEKLAPENATIASGLYDNDQKINWNKYRYYDLVLGETKIINKSGNYHVTGNLKDDSLIIDVPDGEVRLILDNVLIKNSSGPAIVCKEADDLLIELVGENTLIDGQKYLEEYEVKGVIYSRANLAFAGEGTLNIVANFQDGIVGKDNLKINSGTYNIKAADDALRANDALIILGGKINVTSSYEGIEAKIVAIDGGEITIDSSDDGINAVNSEAPDASVDAECAVNITGGNIYLNTGGDGIDSNGYIRIKGGNIAIDGPINGKNSSLDPGINIIMDGGTVIAVGAGDITETLGRDSSIFNVNFDFGTTFLAGTKIEIKDSAGKTVVSHISKKVFDHLIAGASSFTLGEIYTIYINNYPYRLFTISDIVTIIPATDELHKYDRK